MVKNLIFLLFIFLNQSGCAIYDLSTQKEDYAPADFTGDVERIGRQQGRQGAERTAIENGYGSSAALPRIQYTGSQQLHSKERLSVRISCLRNELPLVGIARYKSMKWIIMKTDGSVLVEHSDMTNADGVLVITAEKSYVVPENILVVYDQRISFADLYKRGLEMSIVCPR